MNPTTSNGAIISGALGGAAGLVTSWMWHILPNAQLCNEGYRRNVTAFLEGGPPEVLLERIETYLRAEHPDYIGGRRAGRNHVLNLGQDQLRSILRGAREALDEIRETREMEGTLPRPTDGWIHPPGGLEGLHLAAYLHTPPDLCPCTECVGHPELMWNYEGSD
jgi:hypothetical protein